MDYISFIWKINYKYLKILYVYFLYETLRLRKENKPLGCVNLMGKTITNNIPENAADIISPNLQESMRSNNQRAAIINHQKHK